jgi:UTP--glucose-1-phosphate uridylyltransferase
MKALIPAAGLGTRYLPLTKAVPKELIPVGRFPVLHHVVAEAKAAGCDEIGIILSDGKEAIRDYFSPDPELMAMLDRTGKREMMADWEVLMNGLQFNWIDQKEQRGLGDAILCGEAFAAGEPVCVLLGDTIIEGESPLREMVSRVRSGAGSAVAVEQVPRERATRYGVCWTSGIENGVGKIEAMVEKPSEAAIAARDGEPFVFAARYVLGNRIFELLRGQGAGKNGEIQLTDAMDRLRQMEGFSAVRLQGVRRDVGAPDV